MSTDTRPKPFVFVLMPFSDAFGDIYKFGIKGAAEEAGAYAERVDEQMFVEGILERIYNQISKADIIVADMTAKNPNVFYEVGYAHALGKIVLLVTQKTEDIPFDLKHHPHVVYEGKIDKLKSELVPRIRWAIQESAQRQRGVSSEESLLVYTLGNVEVPEKSTGRDVPRIEGTIQGPGFQLPISVRNGAATTSSDVGYVYMLARPKSAVVPSTAPMPVFGGGYPISGYTVSLSGELLGTSNIVETRYQALQPIYSSPAATEADLSEHYRLPVGIPSLPPGAIEQFFVPLILQPEELANARAELCLRLHTRTNIFDYILELQISQEMKEKKKSVPASE